MKSKKKYILITLLVGLVIGFTSSAFSSEPTSDNEKYNHILYKSQIDKSDGSEVLIREAYFPPNWKAPRHYHNGNLFIYVVEGEFEVELAGSEKITYTKGQALQMTAGVEMEARNPSDTTSLKLAVFQVGMPDAPFVVPVN